jgi:hydroxyacylglutathione hydrolase
VAALGLPASNQVCEALSISFGVSEGDAAAAENPALIGRRSPDHPLPRLALRYWAGPGRRVDRILRQHDEVAGFEVLEVPGHSPGQVAYWREVDRVLILGDVLNNVHVLTGIPGLHEPPWFLTADPVENRRSARRRFRSSPGSSCSATEAPCATRGSSSNSSGACPTDSALHVRRADDGSGPAPTPEA